MGLDISHDCWHGAYSAFNRWRDKLAGVAGYAIADVRWEDGLHSPTIMVDWGHLQGNLEGEWETTPDDPLLVLIVHSDCDGKIKPEQASLLADRLVELLPLLPEGDGGGHIRDWKEKTQLFINGLRDAVARREDVEFW